MKSTLNCILAFIALLTFASCQKEIPTKLTGYFYTTDIQISEAQYRLFVDGVDKGPLPYIDQSIEKLTKIDSAMKLQALKLEFMSGTHLVQSKDATGKIVSSSDMYFEFYKNKTKTGVSGSIGASGNASFEKNTEVVIWLAKEPK